MSNEFHLEQVFNVISRIILQNNSLIILALVLVACLTRFLQETKQTLVPTSLHNGRGLPAKLPHVFGRQEPISAQWRQ